MKRDETDARRRAPPLRPRIPRRVGVRSIAFRTSAPWRSSCPHWHRKRLTPAARFHCRALLKCMTNTPSFPRRREPSDFPSHAAGAVTERPRNRDAGCSRRSAGRNVRSHGWRGLARAPRRFRVIALTPQVDFPHILCRILRLSMETLALPLAGPSFWRMCARPRGGVARQAPSGNPGRRPAGVAAATGTSPYATSNPSDCGWSFPACRWQRPNNQDTSPIF